MIARLDVVVEGDRVVGLAASPPLAAKVLTGAHGPELVVVGAAASLVEGDRLTVALRLGPHARLTVRTAAATLAHPCPCGGATAFHVDAELAPGARLAWLPEPLVACAGCRHLATSRVRLATGARAVWSESVTLGRSGEEPGDVELRLDVEVDGVPLLRDGLRAGPSAPGWEGPAVADGARHLGTVALLGARPPSAEPAGVDRGHLLHLAGPGVVARATGAGGAGGAAVERTLAGTRRALVAALWGEFPPVTGSPSSRLPERQGTRQEMVI